MNSKNTGTSKKRKLHSSDDVPSPSRIALGKSDTNLNVVHCSSKAKQSDLRRFFMVKENDRKKRKIDENTGIIPYKIP